MQLTIEDKLILCGCNHMRLIVNNLLKQENIPVIGNYDVGVYMMKYNELRVQKI